MCWFCTKCMFIFYYFIVTSKQSYNLGISHTGDTICLVVQQRVAVSEIRLTDINCGQTYFILLEQLVLEAM